VIQATAPDERRSRRVATLPTDILLGWAIPGAGHFFRGFRRQGAIVLAVVVPLFVAGLFLSDFEAVSRELHPYAFWAELGVGGGTIPLHLIDPAKGEVLGPRESIERPVPSWDGAAATWQGEIGARTDTGVLFCCVAGLLNLLALFDLVDRSLSPKRVPRGSAVPARDAAPAGGGST
jgi:hypothetical protein